MWACNAMKQLLISMTRSSFLTLCCPTRGLAVTPLHFFRSLFCNFLYIRFSRRSKVFPRFGATAHPKNQAFFLCDCEDSKPLEPQSSVMQIKDERRAKFRKPGRTSSWWLWKTSWSIPRTEKASGLSVVNGRYRCAVFTRSRSPPK